MVEKILKELGLRFPSKREIVKEIQNQQQYTPKESKENIKKNILGKLEKDAELLKKAKSSEELYVPLQGKVKNVKRYIHNTSHTPESEMIIGIGANNPVYKTGQTTNLEITLGDALVNSIIFPGNAPIRSGDTITAHIYKGEIIDEFSDLFNSTNDLAQLFIKGMYTGEFVCKIGEWKDKEVTKRIDINYGNGNVDTNEIK